MRTKIIFVIAVILLSVTSAMAQTTHTAASCSYNDVNTKISQPSTVSGDTIHIPAGSCNWGSSYVSTTKYLTIIGAGSGTSSTCDGSVSTCISTSSSYGAFSFTNTTLSSFPLNISKLHITATGGRVMTLTGKGTDWRIHHNYFYSAGTSAAALLFSNINVSTHELFGLVDNNIFNYTKVDGLGVTATTAASSWEAATGWGTSNAIFIENNTFTTFSNCDASNTKNAVDSNGGIRYVVRYNDFKDARMETHSACQSTVRGTRMSDVYNNKFLNSCTSSPYVQTFAARGGALRFTRNMVAGNWRPDTGNGGPMIDNRRSWFDSSCTSGLGNCDGTGSNDTFTVTHPGNAVGDNILCLDQPGAGAGAKGSQTLEPVYTWGNVAGNICIGGSNKYGICTSNADCPSSTCTTKTLTPNVFYRRNDTNNMPYQIVAGRDYFDDSTGSNIPYESVIYYPADNYNTYTCPHPLADPSAQGSCATSGDSQYGKAGYTLTGEVTDTTAPTVTSFYVYGSTTLINFSEAITSTSGAAFTVSGLASALTLTCPAVTTAASSMTCDNSRTVYQSEGNGAYGYTGTKVVDAASNALAEISSNPTAINLSTEVEVPPTVTLTINKSGSGCVITSTPAGVSCGSTCSASYESGTAVQLGGYLYNGWASITYGGDCASDGTVTMSGNKVCTVTCTADQILALIR